MKRIILASRGKRILASFIDLIILLFFTSVVYFSAVFPFVFDSSQIEANSVQIVELFKQCDLFLVDDQGNYAAKTKFSEVDEIQDLFSVDLTFKGKEYKDVQIVKSLYTYSTEKFSSYAGEYNYTLSSFCSEVLKVGQEESNIAAFDETTYTFTMIDGEKWQTTFIYFVNVYEDMAANAISKSQIQVLTNENQNIVIQAIVYVIPVVIGVSFIFNLLIPLIAPYGQTIGKFITKLIVLDKNGYRLKRIWLLPRWLVYILLEFILGICTFGATFLITYTMFVFNKKRRCIHDYAANSIVADKADSIFFNDKAEEEYYQKRLKEKQKASELSEDMKGEINSHE